MPATTKPAGGQAERMYPNLEQFLETTERKDAPALFASTRARLEELAKGAKGPMAKKALAGIEKAEALLDQLHGVREKLAEQNRAARKPRR